MRLILGIVISLKICDGFRAVTPQVKATSLVSNKPIKSAVFSRIEDVEMEIYNRSIANKMNDVVSLPSTNESQDDPARNTIIEKYGAVLGEDTGKKIFDILIKEEKEEAILGASILAMVVSAMYTTDVWAVATAALLTSAFASQSNSVGSVARILGAFTDSILRDFTNGVNNVTKSLNRLGKASTTKNDDVIDEFAAVSDSNSAEEDENNMKELFASAFASTAAFWERSRASEATSKRAESLTKLQTILSTSESIYDRYSGANWNLYRTSRVNDDNNEEEASSEGGIDTYSRPVLGEEDAVFDDPAPALLEGGMLMKAEESEEDSREVLLFKLMKAVGMYPSISSVDVENDFAARCLLAKVGSIPDFIEILTAPGGQPLKQVRGRRIT
jgi:hypothetical protein